MKNIIGLIESSGILQNLDECEKLKSLAKESPSFKTLLLEEINSRILNLKKRIGYIEKDQKQIGQLTSVMKGYHTELPVQKSKLKNLKDLVEFVSDEQKGIVKTSDIKAIPNFENYQPNFKEEITGLLFEILKDHFDKNQQNDLKVLLEKGDEPKHKLYFKGNGNRLADAFKSLIDTDFITGCDKKELQEWIFNSFQYRGKSKLPTDFTIRYLEDIISSNSDNCKKPILEVKKENHQYIITKV